MGKPFAAGLRWARWTRRSGSSHSKISWNGRRDRMSANDLESLTITKIRGFVEPFTLTFDKDRKLCIVYGENGTGKSTLCDALDLLGSEAIGSLDGRGLGKIERYLA